MKYKIEPVTDEFNGIIQDTAVEMEIEISHKVGDPIARFDFVFYNNTGGEVRRRWQNIDSDALGQYSKEAAKSIAEQTQNITIID